MSGRADPFGTAALREAALSAWAASPTRLREDANLEEDQYAGYYRDRVLVELAQNAADAAASAGAGGHLLLRLSSDDEGPMLLAANTGAPLGPDGVAALASMRASAKTSTDDGGRVRSVGRFGVGFAAVRAVSDDITIASTTGAVRFVLEEAAAAIAERAAHPGTHPGMAQTAVSRETQLPILRLPFAADAAPPAGFDTAVTLRLRDAGAARRVEGWLRALDDTLLLALPGLAAVTLEWPGQAPSRLDDVAGRWHLVTREGELPPEALADSRLEDRTRTRWRVTWALPRERGNDWPRVIHAPTATDEPTTMPALLVATLPVDPGRRRIAPGRATDAVVAAAGEAYGELARELVDRGATTAQLLDLVPLELPASDLDHRLRTAALEALGRADVLRDAHGGPVAPRHARTLAGAPGKDTDLLRALDVPGLVAVPATHLSQARALGVCVDHLSDVIEDLPTGREPTRWRELYDALAPHTEHAQVALAMLPVPVVGGAVRRSARGLVIAPSEAPGPDGEADQAVAILDALEPFGLRVVHPDAVHPLLERLGATSADAVTLLRHDAVRDAIGAVDLDGDSPLRDEEAAPIIEAVLHLARVCADEGFAGRGPSWLGALPLRAEDGSLLPACELTLPGSWAEHALTGLDVVETGCVRRWGAAALKLVGVREHLSVRTMPDVVAEEHPVVGDVALDGWEDYLVLLATRLGEGAYVGDLAVVEDLDAADEGVWPTLLQGIAQDPPARAALLEQVRAHSGPGLDTAPSYTAWWWRDALDGPFAVPGAQVPLLREAPDAVVGLDEAVLTALGGVRDLTGLDGGGWAGYLDALPEEGTVISRLEATMIWRALAAAAERGIGPDSPPERLPGLVRGTPRIAGVDELSLADEMWSQLEPAVLPAPRRAIELLEQSLQVTVLDLDVEVSPCPVGAEQEVPDVVHAAVVAGAWPPVWILDPELAVEGRPVPWWVDDGVPRATSVAGAARAIAYLGSAWGSRHVIEQLLGDPAVAADVLRDTVFD